MTIWATAMLLATTSAAIGFVVIAALWLKKLRRSLTTTVSDSAHQQLKAAQRLSEAVALLHRQQTAQEKQIQSLTEANLNLQREIAQLSEKVETNKKHQPQATVSAHRVLH